MNRVRVTDLLEIVVDEVAVIRALPHRVGHSLQTAGRALVGVVSAGLIGVNLVRNTALNIANPRRDVPIWIGNALQAAANAPVVEDNSIERVLRSHHMA